MKKSKKILSVLLALSLFLTSVQVPAFAAQPGGEAAEAKAAPEAGAPSAEISAGDASDGKASETNADPAGASDPASANAKMAEAADAEPAQTEETAAEPEKAASADPDAGKAADTGKPADTASEDPDAGKAANAGKAADAGKPADAEKPAETFAGEESAENAGSEEAEAEEAETAAGVSLLDGEKWLEASTLGDDVTLDGNYVFREGYLDLNGHTLTINGYLLHTDGDIDVHGGKLLVTGDYRLQNRSDDGTEFSSCGGALVMRDADSYVKVGGVFYASGDYGYYDREHVWRTEPLTEGTLEIGKGLYQSGRSDSFKSSGSHRVLLSGAGTGKTVTVSFENDNSYVGILEMAEGANILWEGYFNVEKLGNDVELSTSKEEGRAFRIRSGDARMSFNGHNLTVNGNVDNLSGELYVGGAHLAGEGFDPANAGSLTINGSLLQNDGDLVVDGGEVTVTGDWRLQKRNSEGQYETAGGALVMVNESDRASVGGMLYASGDYGYYDLAHVWTTDMMTAGTLTIGKGLRQSGRNDAFKAKDDHRTVIAGAGEDHKASVFFESADSYLGILEMAEGADISWEGVFNVQKLGNNVTIKTDTAKNEGIVIYSKDDWTRFSGHCLTVNGNVKDLVGSLYVGGAHLTEDFDAANAGSLVIDGDFLHQSGDLVADGGSVTVTGDWLNQHLNNDGTYDSCGGALVMIHENDRVNVGGTFYASGDYGYYDLEHVWRTSMLTAGTLTIGRGLYQSRRSDSFKAKDGHRTVLAGAGEGQKVSVVFENADSCLGILEMAEGADISWEGYFNVQSLGNDVTVKTDTAKNEGITVYSKDARMSFNGHCLTVKGNVKDLVGSLYVGGAHLADAFDPEKAGSLVIDGDFLHQSGDLIADGGSVTVTGDWRNQHLNDDGTYSACDGALVMVHDDDRVSVGGTFYMSGDYGYYDLGGIWRTEKLSAGTLTIGRGFHQSLRGDAFVANKAHKVVLAGAGDGKDVSVSFESDQSSLGILAMADGANVDWEGIFNVQTLGSDVEIHTSSVKNDGIIIYSNNDRMDFHGNTLTIDGNVKDLRGSLYVGGEHLAREGQDPNAYGSFVVNGDFLHQSGDLIVDCGKVTVTGDWRNQELKNDGTYGACGGALVMLNEKDSVNIGGNLYMSGDYGYYDLGGIWQTAKLTAGTLTVDGSFFQSLRSDAFCASDAHKTVVGGKAVQMETDSGSCFATLEITRDPSEYIFSQVPCWTKLVYNGNELTEDDISFSAALDPETNELTILKWKDPSAEIEIPQTINDCTVAGIGRDVFRDRKDLKKVTLPDTVTTIGGRAFYNCEGLEEVVLPASLKTIDFEAFRNCASLASPALPAGLESIGDSAFQGCVKFTEIAFPGTLVIIGDYAFRECGNLQSLAIPSAVTTIGNDAFHDCGAVLTLAFAKSSRLEFIGSHAFEGLTQITEVVIPDGTTRIDSYAFCGCTSLKHVSVPASVTNMGECIFKDTQLTTAGLAGSGSDYEFAWTEKIPGYAFDNLEKLVSADIPATVTEIGQNAYRGCASLSAITLPAGLVKMERGVFSECTSLTKAELPESLSEIHEYIFFRCENLEEAVFLGNSPITELPIGMFQECRKLKEIDIPAGVVKILSHAFSECETMTEVSIPAGVTDIEVNAFLNCKGLAKVNFAEGCALTTIHAGAFGNDTALTAFTIPESVTTLGNAVFYNCANLAKVTVPAGVERMDEQVFRGTALKSAGPIGSGADYEFGWTETIPNYAFDYITELTSVELPDTVTAMGRNVFSECHSLETIILPKALTTLGREAFNECRSLTAIELPEGLEVLPESTFRGCAALEEVILHENLREIQSWAFERCKALERLELPEGVTTIRRGAVSYCDSLVELIVPASAETIEDNAIYKTDVLVMFVEQDSAAQQYAEENDIPFEYMTNLGRTVTANVTDQDGAAIAGGFIVNWYSADTDAFLGTGRKLRNAAEGTKVLCRVVLDEALGTVYVQPDDAAYTCTDKDGSIELKLVPFEAAKISGSVKDVEGKALSGASLKIKQTFNGIYEKTLTAAADENGEFSIDAWKTQAVVTASKEGYYDEMTTLSAADLATGAAKAELVLEKIPEDKVTLNITVKKAAAAGAEPETAELSGTASLTFSVYNKTKDKQLAQDTEFRVQYPYVTLRGDAAAAGDTLEFSVTDASGKLADGKTEVTLDENRCGTADWTFVENGSLSVTGISSAGKNVRVMIFDGKGICRENGSAGSSYKTGTLPAGAYTLVFMEKSPLLTSVDSFGRLAEMGLAEGTDYAKKTANVAAGVIGAVEDVKVPAFDESKLYYTVADATRVTISSTKAVTGQYVTARVQFEIDGKYASSGETLKIEMPAGMSFVERSLTLNGKASACTVTENADGTASAAVPVNAKSGIIRFYVLPKAAGTQKFHAYLSFSNDGNAVTQPIGEASIEVSNATIQVPGNTGFTTVTATGKAPAGCEITLYDNGTEVGQTTSKKNGSWSLDFALVNQQKYSAHEIYAAVESADFGHIDTDTARVMYNKSYIEVSKVTMINTAHLDKTCEFVTVFDFLHPSAQVPSYNYWPAYPTFTFIVEFTGGDEDVLSNVRVTTRNSAGDLTYVPCTYDAESRQWIGTHNYTSFQEVPVSVGVLSDNSSGDDIDMSLDVEAAASSLSRARTLSDKALAMVSERADTDNVVVGDEAVSFDLKMGEQKIGSYKVELLDYATFDIDDWEDYVEYEDESGEISYQASAFEGSSYVIYEAYPADKLLVKSCVTLSAESGDLLGGAAKELLEALAGAMRGDAEALAGFKIFSNVDNWIKTIETVREICSDFSDLLEDLSGIKEYSDLMEDFVKLYYYVPALQDIIDNLLKPTMERKACPCIDSSSFSGILADLQKEINSYRNKAFLLLGGMLAANALMDYAGGKALKFAGKAGEKGVKELYKYIMKRFGKQMSRSAKKVVKAGIKIAGEEIEGYAEDQWSNLTDKITSFFDVRGHIEKGFEDLQKKIRDKAMEIGSIKCPCTENGGECKCNQVPEEPDDEQDATPIADPSGYVYEAVPSNRLGGVTATIYEYTYAVDEFGVQADEKSEILWDAAAYDQVNPQTTREDGTFGWDVPEGQWLVRFTKEGYEDADSHKDVAADKDGYLPVPPIQTEVNTAMVSKAAPAVANAAAYPAEVQIDFTQYMQIDTVNTGNVTVTANGKSVSGTVVPLDAEDNYEGTAQYASAFAFRPSEEISGSVTIKVSGAKSYNGKAMAAAYEKTETVEPMPKSLEISGATSLKHRETAELTVKVLPAEAGANRTITITAYSPSILSAASTTVSTDANGVAKVTLAGNLPGQGILGISLDGTKLSEEISRTVYGAEEETPKVRDLAESGYEITLDEETFTYDGTEKKPAVTIGALVEETDYTLAYENNINAGTAKVTASGIGKYTGTLTKEFTIEKAAQTLGCKVSTVSVGEKAVFAITGAKGAKFTVTSSNKSVLKVVKTAQSSRKFQVQGVAVGTAKLTIKVASTDNYLLGKKTVTVKVVPAATTKIQITNLATGLKVAWAKVAGATGYKIYCNNTLIKTITSAATNSLKHTKANTNGKKYVYKVVATASTGTSSLSKSATAYRVAPTAFTVAKNSAAGTIGLKWSKNAKATGYQVQYSLNKSFSKVKTLTVKGAASLTKKIAKLTKGKTYYVRVRAYKTVSKTTFYSSWSAAKAVKITK